MENILKKSKKVNVYIDGYNLYFGMKDAGFEHCKWLDVYALANLLKNESHILATVKYFTARIPNTSGKGKRQAVYIDAGDEQSYFAIEYFEKDFAVYRNGSFKQRMDSDCFQPVELTPEILEASCGFSSFKKRKNLTLYYKNYIDDFCIEYTQYLGEFGFYLYGYRFPHKKIQYLHNLQNTHHSLKGEELQIDINKLNKQP